MSGDAYSQHLGVVRGRMDKALAAAGFERVVISAGEAHKVFLDDQHYGFRANPHFLHWVPLTRHPGAFIVYAAGETPVLLYPVHDDYWHAPPTPPDPAWAVHFDVRPCRSRADAIAQLPSAAAAIGEESSFGPWRPAALNPQGMLNRLHYDRAIKTDYELGKLRTASRHAANGHQAAVQAFEAGSSEFGILSLYCTAVGQSAAELPYGAIVALNEHAAVLHYQYTDPLPPQTRRSFLIDAGASCDGYAADITRTHAGGGSGAFSDLLAGMDALQRAICNDVRAGVDFVELHQSTHARIARLLIGLGVLHCTEDEALATGLTRPFFPHGLGHLLGLQVHDVGGFSTDREGGKRPPPAEHPHLRLTRTLETDMVLTIEPGVYIIDSLLQPLKHGPQRDRVNWTLVDRLRPFGGVRIEDNLRVTAHGHENLTRAVL